MSRLAEAYDGGRTRLSAAQIADSRHQRRPFVAKILSVLSQARLVNGTRGPGGGFALAREPAEISLYEVFRLFDRDVEHETCPFSGGQCPGMGAPCVLHERLSQVRQGLDRLLRETTFEVFREAAQGGANGKGGAHRQRADPAGGARKTGGAQETGGAQDAGGAQETGGARRTGGGAASKKATTGAKRSRKPSR